MQGAKGKVSFVKNTERILRGADLRREGVPFPAGRSDPVLSL